LRDVSLTATAGEWVAVVGPNGAGKSTLLRAIAALTPRKGTITIGGNDIAALRPRERALLVAMVVQSPLVPAGATVVDYVALGARRMCRCSGSRRSATTTRSRRRCTASTSTSSRIAPSRRCPAASGSACSSPRALAQDAPVLLLDEPTTALDVGHQQDVLELIDELRVERNLVVITSLHDLTLAAQYADRVVLLDRGTTVADGPPAEVLTERLLTMVFGASVRVIHDDQGIAIVARRSGRAPHSLP